MVTLLRLVAWLLVAVMVAFWVWGQDLLDGMATRIGPVALVLPLGAAAVCGATWWVRCARQRASGVARGTERGIRLDVTLTMLGLFIVAWPFAFVLDRMGHTPHQTFVSAGIAAAWDAGGLVLIVFVGLCALVVGKHGPGQGG